MEHSVFEDLIDYFGGYVLDDEGLMPPDYLSQSVTGARIELVVATGEPGGTNGTTNEFGHFETFVRHEEPVGQLDLALSTTGCPLDKSMKSVSTPSTAQVLPRQGVTIVSDIDDVLRECEVWNLKQMLLNTFARPFEPWSDESWHNEAGSEVTGIQTRIHGQPLGSMPRVYQQWKTSLSQHKGGNIHFHYVSEAPEMSHEFYVKGISQYYPAGSFDFRPMIIDTYSKFMNSRYDNIRRLIETFPARQFILVGDTSTPAMLQSYRKLAKHFPQVQCILIRDTSATEPANWFANDLRHMPDGRFMIFNTPHELLVNPDMNVTELLHTLSSTTDPGVGCGPLRGHDAATIDAGRFALLKTILKGVEYYFTCWLLTLGRERPSKDCIFDRRGLLKYAPVPEYDEIREVLVGL